MFQNQSNHSNQSITVDDDHGEGKLTDNTSKAQHLVRGRPTILTMGDSEISAAATTTMPP